MSDSNKPPETLGEGIPLHTAVFTNAVKLVTLDQK